MLFQKASTSDIRKAYRKLSTHLHPDRNRNENADEEFRQVGSNTKTHPFPALLISFYLFETEGYLKVFVTCRQMD